MTSRCKAIDYLCAFNNNDAMVQKPFRDEETPRWTKRRDEAGRLFLLHVRKMKKKDWASLDTKTQKALSTLLNRLGTDAEYPKAGSFSAFLLSLRAGANPRGDFIRDTQMLIEMGRFPGDWSKDPNWPTSWDGDSGDLQSFMWHRNACSEAIEQGRLLWLEYQRWWKRVELINWEKIT